MGASSSKRCAWSRSTWSVWRRSREACSDSTMCLRERPRLLGIGARGPIDLGEDLDGVAPAPPGQGPAEDRLGPALGVDVRRVERRDARLEGGAHAGEGRILFDLVPVGDPVAVGEGGDGHTRTAEVAIVHEPERTRGFYARSHGWVGGTPLRVRARVSSLPPWREISWRATTAGGPGGQHANRTLSRVEVQFDVGGLDHARAPPAGPAGGPDWDRWCGPAPRSPVPRREPRAGAGPVGRQDRCGPARDGVADADGADQGLPAAAGRGEAAPIGDETAPQTAGGRRVSPSGERR